MKLKHLSLWLTLHLQNRIAEQAKYIPYGPMRKSSINIIKKGEPYFHTGGNIDIMPHMPTRSESFEKSCYSGSVLVG